MSTIPQDPKEIKMFQENTKLSLYSLSSKDEMEMYNNMLYLKKKVCECSDSDVQELVKILKIVKSLIYKIKRKRPLSRATCKIYENIKRVPRDPKFHSLAVYSEMQRMKKYN